jgi:hypothetical protein
MFGKSLGYFSQLDLDPSTFCAEEKFTSKYANQFQNTDQVNLGLALLPISADARWHIFKPKI